MSSKLAKIESNHQHPMDLFAQWLGEVNNADEKGSLIEIMNIATVNKEHGVLNRNVLLKKHNKDGFVFVTEKNSRKYSDLKENPKIAATFLWNYKVNDIWYARQIRVNGTVSELSAQELPEFYANEPLFAKIRCKICKCGQPCDWNDLKKHHDEVLKNFLNGSETLPQNENYTALLISPSFIDFYDVADDNEIADRLLFTKDPKGNWTNQHIFA